MSLNVVTLIGRMTKDADLRQTAGGKSTCNFSIAVDKRVKPQDGSSTADFFNIVAWGQTAEFAANYLGKGRLVGVSGRLQTRKYQSQDGGAKEVTEIVADSVYGLDRPRDEGVQPGKAKGAQKIIGQADNLDYDPFAEE